MRVPKRGPKRKIAKEEKCSEEAEAQKAKPSRNTRSGCKSRRAPGLVILRYGGSPAKNLGCRVDTGRRPDLREDYDPTALHSAIFSISSHTVLSFWPTEEIGWMDNLGGAYWNHLSAVCLLHGFITGLIDASGKVVGS
ncbi:uncharacterized protein BO88DRAFT_430262 [Aspergillus vadensis CBS 113365]|uniref:Uncharacterized protein n=1 Tax=Aspergillus vadensis (strain CBS 113365 / IMI 142717 / IBT 24658) TaxID=1448311 RepID=A0A319ATF3_ASPVC|nr:hypothetical protein BO88DRAFT_430262 [Aspergillus vadensis CBS 113365]PYH63606.1 hypothetical protein BO88DRAFT_430262 [Aspergillus vadensis CBS 113365]